MMRPEFNMPTTICQAAGDIRQGRLSPVALLESCLSAIDQREESIRAWVIVDRDGARVAARHAEEEIRQGHWRGPMHGIPIGVKDIIDVVDLPTAAGSRLWAQSIARQDATCVQAAGSRRYRSRQDSDHAVRQLRSAGHAQ